MRKPLASLLRSSALFLGLLAVSAYAQRRDARSVPVPPQPVQFSITARRGQPLEVPLRIYGRQSEVLKFLIRTPPEHGKLSTPRTVERDSGVVAYEPPADLSITSDKFSYAVQSSAGVSGAVEVFIKIEDVPPRLIMPDTIEFPTLLAGKTATARLEIANRGGGLAEGEIEVNAPWSISGDRKYRLAANATREFQLLFSPQGGGSFREEVRYTSDREHTTVLRGQAEAPLTVSPARLILRHAVGDPVRRGSLEFANQTEEPIVLALRSNSRLRHPVQVEVGPRSKQAITIQTNAADTAALDAELHADAQGFALVVPVHAEIVGAVLRVNRESISFGRVASSQPSQATFELENIGGEQGFAVFEVAAPFALSQPSSGLQPGEKKEFLVTLPATSPGRLRTWLKVQAEEQRFELPVDAEVVSGNAIKDSATGGRRRAERGDVSVLRLAARASPDSDGGTLPSIVDPSWIADYFLPPGVAVASPGAGVVKIAWPVALSSASKFRVERRVLALDQKRELQVHWVNAPAQFSQQKSHWVAEVNRLPAAQPLVLRVLPLSANGAAGERLFAVNAQTPPPPRLLPAVTPLRGLFFGLAVCGALLLWKRRGERAGSWGL